MTPEDLIEHHGISLSTRGGSLIFTRSPHVKAAEWEAFRPHERAIIAELKRRAAVERVILFHPKPVPTEPRRPDWRLPGISRWQEAQRVVDSWRREGLQPSADWTFVIPFDGRSGHPLEIPSRLKPEVMAILSQEVTTEERRTRVSGVDMSRWPAGGGAA